MLLKQSYLGSIFSFSSWQVGLRAPGIPVATLALLAAGMILASGCAASADKAIEVSLESNFQLRVGQSALVRTEKLQVGILAVTSDSRCGKDEVCIWEGDAIVRIWLQLAGEDKQERELHTGSREPNAADYAGYGVVLVSLSPAPVSGHSIAPTEYIATLRVTRGISGDRNIY